MSYCRFAWNGSDVYVFNHYQGGIECCGCRLNPESFFNAPTPEAMLAHLADHKKAGHFVPLHAVVSLWRDVAGPNAPVNPEPAVLTRYRYRMREINKLVRREQRRQRKWGPRGGHPGGSQGVAEVSRGEEKSNESGG